MPKQQKEKMIKCKFCGKEIEESKIIYGKSSSITICENCINICNHIIEDRTSPSNDNKETIILKPTEIKAKLDEYIVGQEEAKKIISVAVYNHYKRVFKLKNSDVDVQKTNIALIGPTGCGKTLIAKTIAKLINVPIVIADATTITQQGYVGKSVEDSLMQLVKEANGDVELAQRGIIFIDEIDKLAGVESDNTRDISGEGVQQSLLKMIEGSEMYLTPEKDKLFGSENIKIDTTNILFLVGGSFVGLEEIIEQRLNKKMVGFGAQRLSNDKKKNLLKYVTHEDLVKFGMIPEFMGRIQVLATLNKLEEEELIKILKEPKDALIKQYIELFKVDKIDLSFDDNAIKKIAHIAIKKKTGARGLKSIIENTMLDIMYSSPTNNVSNVVIKENDVIENSLMIE